ncbi:NADH:flavin oxidoreductase/NADH oxidase [Lactarius sanguifluus]|nr:NADH:flavin oxidoreductase/NADH oxidase [Lactarius sanguifluus]
MTPLTRYRADKDHVHGEAAKTYYAQRSISEATFIAPQAGGYPHTSGIWMTPKSLLGNRFITDAVHANGSYIFPQLWAPGRVAIPVVLEQEGGFDLVTFSPIPLENNVPHELTVAEIKEHVQLYSNVASNAIKAGFDGVEIHSANDGYLLDQFLQTVSNERTDESGENRVRLFLLVVINAVAKAVGAERTTVWVGPWSLFQGMGMKDPLPTFTTFIERIRDVHPNLAVIEPRINGNFVAAVTDENRVQSNEVLDRPYIAAGGMDCATAMDTVSKYGGLVAFGRHIIANASHFHSAPDIPLRLKEGKKEGPPDAL